MTQLIVRDVEYHAGMGDPVYDTTGAVRYAVTNRELLPHGGDGAVRIHRCERCGCTYWKPKESARHRCS